MRPPACLAARVGALLLSAIVWPVIAADLPTGTQLETLLGAGFDSNPAQTRDGPSLGFAALAVSATQPLPWFPSLRLEGDLWLRDYAGKNDNGRLDTGLVSSQRFGATQVDLWTEAGWYRDQLVRADERNETALGVLARRPLSRRFDLALFAERRWLDYRNLVLPWAGRPGGIGLSVQGQRPGLPHQGRSGAGRACDEQSGNGQRERAGQGGTDHQGMGQGLSKQPDCGPRISPQARKDRFDLIRLDTTWYPTATVSLTLGLDAGRRESSITLDSYRQQGTRLAMSFDPSPFWSLTAELGLSRRNYWEAPQALERIDDQRWLGITLQRWIADGALYCSLDLLDSRSTIQAEAFTQWVSDCGWRHRF